MKLIILIEILIVWVIFLKVKFFFFLVESFSGKEEVEKFISDFFYINEVFINGGFIGLVGNMIYKFFVVV